MNRRRVFVNGKYLQHPMTGTERYAYEVSRRVLTAQAVPTVLLLPRGVAAPPGVDPRVCRSLPVRGLVFEQLALPVVTAGAMLLNLGGPAPLLKRRQLVVMHDATPFRRLGTFSRLFVAWYLLLYTVLTRTARHLVTVSAFSARELADVFGVPAQRFHLAPCGGDHLTGHGEGVRPAALPAQLRPFAFMLGTLARHKNLTPTAQALTAAGVELVVVGAGGSAEVFTGSGTAGLPTSAHLLGRVPDEEVRWLFGNAAVFVFPSRYEGFGIPLVEAQLAGCPVVASTAAALPEAGGDGALWFDPDDPGAAVAAVRQVLAMDDAARAALVAAGRRNAERFSWDAAAQVVLSLATDDLGHPAPPAVGPVAGANRR